MQFRCSFRPVLVVLAMALLASGFQSLSPGPECHAEDLLYPLATTSINNEGALEHELLTLTNKHRTQHGLPSLVTDDALVKIARDHSSGMARQGFISHDHPSGDLKTRINRAGYPHQVIRENIALAPSVYKAQNALVNSPGHEQNILAKDVTRVGIGIARCKPPFEKELYITEIFASAR
ncbi:MAG: colicin production protein [Acidobacteria bacterium]|jgi:uncharacterized protein YkwD|nr:colicin production protein [Acidobacteriota bacterium]